MKFQLKYCLIILLAAVPWCVQAGPDPCICHSKVKVTSFKQLSAPVKTKYAVVQVFSNNDREQIAGNLRNIIAERLMELGDFEKVFLSAPDSCKNECLIIKTTVADFTTSDPNNIYAMSFLFGLSGVATSMAQSQGEIAVKTEIFANTGDSAVCSSGFYSTASRGISQASVPYKSIVCIAEAITKFALEATGKTTGGRK